MNALPALNQKLSNWLEMIHVYHVFPSISKWNKVAHRLFCYISKNREGKPLLDIKTIVSYTSSTKTKTRLTVNCVVDMNRE